MKPEDLAELHNIAAITNIRSIMERRILSHRRASAVPHQDLAMPEMQEIRRNKRVPGGRSLHEYASLYICARNPMLYKRKEWRRELCVLRIGTAVLDIPGSVITDQNAATKYVRFFASPAGLLYLNQERVFAEYWTHNDLVEEWRHKAAKCAEVLVPDRVDPVHIIGAYVSCKQSHGELLELMPRLPVTVDAHLFFNRG